MAKRKEHLRLDPIVKDICDSTGALFVSSLLGEPIPFLKLLKTEIGEWMERRFDYVFESENEIIHIEFQFWNDAEMVYRMNAYRILLRKQGKKPVRQYVIYCGAEHCRMSTDIQESDWHFKYKLIDIEHIPASEFFQSDVPEVIIWAVLAKQDAPPEETIRNILQKIKEKLAKNKVRMQKVMTFFRYLSILRKMEPLVISLAEEMNINQIADISVDPYYQKGLELGIQTGMEKGIEKGIQTGIQKGKIADALRMLSLGLDINLIVQITELPKEQILALTNK